eukprot:7119509-Prorocentrum_lima.AAC.1
MKQSAKPEILSNASDQGIPPNADNHLSFRELMRNRHKAYLNLVSWIVRNVDVATNVVTSLGYE